MADFLTYTSTYLKEQGLINGNTDDSIITPIIILVQDKYLHPILGTDLFNVIKAEVIAEDTSARIETLLDEYVAKVMLWYVLSEATPSIKYRWMNKGVVSKSGENTSAADLNEIKFLMDQMKINAKMYAERLTRFLNNNTEDYPEYSANTDCEDIQPNKTNYSTSIYLGDSDISDKERIDIKLGNYE